MEDIRAVTYKRVDEEDDFSNSMCIYCEYCSDCEYCDNCR